MIGKVFFAMHVAPKKLRSDNFTPPARTPWGGRNICTKYKAGLGLGSGSEIVGESWEISVEPDFLSYLATEGGEPVSLAGAIAEAPEAWLGPEIAARYGGQTPLLVKLLDSADNLSVQVHPRDGDTALADDESGKPESWVVLDAEPGAGFYLGFRPGVGRGDVERILREEGDLSQALNFVPVLSGDAFVIAAGTPHAVGAGVTLVEPQFVSPGRRGLTYRFWDWNRYYDGQGRRTTKVAGGRLRELHVARSLAVTDWAAPRGQAFVESCRATPMVLEPGRRQLVDWEWFRVEEWSGSRTLRLPGGEFWALTAVEGAAEVRTTHGDLSLRRGESGVVPASATGLEIELVDAKLIATTHAQPRKAPVT